MAHNRPLWRCLQWRWIIFVGCLTFFVAGIAHHDGWPTAQTVLVLGIAYFASAIAVALYSMDE